MNSVKDQMSQMTDERKAENECITITITITNTIMIIMFIITLTVEVTSAM